jgi:hypothetical protein
MFHLLLVGVIVGKCRIHVGDSELERFGKLLRGQITVALFDLLVDVEDGDVCSLPRR